LASSRGAEIAKCEVPYNYRANIDHEIPDEVSFQYWEHGLWKETVPAEDE